LAPRGIASSEYFLLEPPVFVALVVASSCPSILAHNARNLHINVTATVITDLASLYNLSEPFDSPNVEQWIKIDEARRQAKEETSTVPDAEKKQD
jgi:hypothetical protein